MPELYAENYKTRLKRQEGYSDETFMSRGNIFKKLSVPFKLICYIDLMHLQIDSNISPGIDKHCVAE